MNRRPPQPRDRASATRRDRKNRNRKKPDYLVGFRTLLVLVLIGQCLRVAFASPRLNLREISVTGTERLGAAEVAREGQVPLGQNIFRVNLVRVSDRLLQDPVIREAVVTRDLPNRINVEIRERQPAYQVACQGTRWDVDAESVVFRKAKSFLQGSVLLEVQPKDLPRLGQKLRPDFVRALAQCRKLAREEGLDLRHLRIDGSEELWLNIATSPTNPVRTDTAEAAETAPAATPGRLKVRVGRMADLPQKFRDIRHALQGWPSLTTAAAHLDVMCPGRPAYMSAAKAEDEGEPQSP